MLLLLLLLQVSDGEMPISSFPPLLRPGPEKCSESICGCTFVLVLTAGIGGFSSFILLNKGDPTAEQMGCFVAIVIEATIAVLCLVGDHVLHHRISWTPKCCCWVQTEHT
jgi:hypothetical protein